MSCRSCASLNQAEFAAEMMIHFIASNLENPGVRACPQISVYMDCGAAWFTTKQAQLRLLGKGIAGSLSAAA